MEDAWVVLRIEDALGNVVAEREGTRLVAGNHRAGVGVSYSAGMKPWKVQRNVARGDVRRKITLHATRKCSKVSYRRE